MTRCTFKVLIPTTSSDHEHNVDAMVAVKRLALHDLGDPAAEHHIRDLLDVSLQWLVAAHSHNPSGVNPLFIWYASFSRWGMDMLQPPM